MPPTIPFEHYVGLLTSLNVDPEIDAILLSKPLPQHLRSTHPESYIAVEKDIEGLHPHNYAASVLDKAATRFRLPSVVKVVLDVLYSVIDDMVGKNVVIINASNLIGKPLSMQLIKEGATVVVCHDKTKCIKSHIANADIVVSAVGIPKLIKGEWLKQGAFVVDVAGDIEFERAVHRASWITPVPGGVGPLCVSHLMNEAAMCFKQEYGIG